MNGVQDTNRFSKVFCDIISHLAVYYHGGELYFSLIHRVCCHSRPKRRYVSVHQIYSQLPYMIISQNVYIPFVSPQGGNYLYRYLIVPSTKLSRLYKRVGEKVRSIFFFIGHNESTCVLQMGIQKHRCPTDIPINNLRNIISSHAWWTPLLDSQQISVWVKMARLGQTIWLLRNLFLTGRLFRRVAFVS